MNGDFNTYNEQDLHDAVASVLAIPADKFVILTSSGDTQTIVSFGDLYTVPGRTAIELVCPC